ncbi:MAG TPA: hypothetical protein VIH42_05615 [Thermoguttaceae bacterium]
MEWLGPLVESHGINIIYLIVLVYIAQTIRPTGQVLSTVLGLADKSMEKYGNLETRVDHHEAESKERNADAIQRDNAIVEFMRTLITGQSTLLGAVDTMAKNVLQTATQLNEVSTKVTIMSEQPEWKLILDNLVEIKDMLAALKTDIAQYGERIEVVEAKANATEAKVISTMNAVATTGSTSKTQARRNGEPKPVRKAPPALPIGDDPALDFLDEVETPVVKPDKPTDTLPTGG